MATCQRQLVRHHKRGRALIFLKAIKREAGYLWGVFKQLLIPIMIAALYGWYEWKTKGDSFVLTEYLNIFLPALFFVMWFVGLYERHKKRVTDKQSFDGISTDLSSLKENVDELMNFARTFKFGSEARAGELDFADSLILGAEKLLKQGDVLAALLQAGVAFEQSIRNLAKRAGIDSPERFPVHRLLEKLKPKIPPEWHGELNTLRVVRNQVSHLPEDGLSKITHPDILLGTYAMAIKMLNSRW